MSSTYLLDANALIALVVADHEHHDSALAWASTVDRVAVCPIVEGALLRFLIRVGESQATASTILSALHASPRCEFWEDAISYTAVNLEHVVGHRQVTNSYLTALAVSRGGKLATFDQGLADAFPDHSQLIS